MRIPILIVLAATLAPAQAATLRKDIPTIAKAANGAVVSIIMSDKNGQPIAQGSGFIISKDGRIVTNYHVIKSGTSAIAKLPDGAFFVVDGVLAVDKNRDIAILKAHGTDFRTVTLGNSENLQIGEEIVAIGNPLSLESTVSNGIISGIRNVEAEGGKFLQVTAPISPGSSGGPLLNMAGDVVGVTTLYLKGGENLNFAVPINDVKRLLRGNISKVHDFPNEASEGGTPSKGFLSNSKICLDGLINTIETPFLYLGKSCKEFVVSLPLAPADAELLEGNDPKDGDLLAKMQIDFMNATSLHLAEEMKPGSWAPLIGAMWAKFEDYRNDFCSRHPRMFVFDLKLDGTATPPEPCSIPNHGK
jgi:Trypsin-like peptidase domain